MKDHLQVNTGVMGSTSTSSLLKRETVASKQENITENEGNVWGGNVDYIDSTSIEGMDANVAFGISSFIRDQALIPEGRMMMGFAHKQVSIDMVRNLF